jgi:hypothetical protein
MQTEFPSIRLAKSAEALGKICLSELKTKASHRPTKMFRRPPISSSSAFCVLLRTQLRHRLQITPHLRNDSGGGLVVLSKILKDEILSSTFDPYIHQGKSFAKDVVCRQDFHRSADFKNYLPFQAMTTNDHRAMYVEFDTKAIFDDSNSAMADSTQRGANFKTFTNLTTISQLHTSILQRII